MAVDRRVQRTRQLLRDSLIELILEKGYDSITVQEITDRANLGRATLYLHYRDKDDLLVSSFQGIYDDLVARMTPLSVKDLSNFSVPAGLTVFQHAKENRDLYLVLLGGQGVGVVMTQIRTYMASVILGFFDRSFAEAEWVVPREIVASYIVGALLNLVMWWLTNDMAYSPEEMAGFFSRLSRQIIRQALKDAEAERLKLQGGQQ